MTVLDRKLITRMVNPQPGGNGGGNSYVPQSQAVSWTDINGKPTTLAGYGITDAYWATTQSTSDKRNLTIGSVTQQVITAHQSLYGYATEYWVGQQGYATQTWVGQQGFATKTWVGNNYLALSGGTMSGSISFNSKDTYNIGSASANLSYLYANSIHPGNKNNLWLYANNNTHIIANGPLIIPISNDVGLSSYGRYALAVGGDPRNNESHIAMDDNEIMAKGSASTSATLYLNAEGGTVCINETAGNCGIGTASPGHKLHVVGRIYCTGGFAFLSDIRKKDVITKDLHISVGDIAKAPLIRYTLKSDEKKEIHIGSVAQYWQNVMPETINESNDGTLSMDYGTISLVSVVTLARKLETLEKELSDIKKKLITK